MLVQQQDNSVSDEIQDLLVTDWEPDDNPPLILPNQRNGRLSLQAVLFGARHPDLTGRALHLWTYYICEERLAGGTRATDPEVAEALGWGTRTVAKYRRWLIANGWLEDCAEQSVYRPRLPVGFRDVPESEAIGLRDDIRKAVTDPRLVRPSHDEALAPGYQRFALWLNYMARGGDGTPVWACRRTLARDLGVSRVRISNIRKDLLREGWLRIYFEAEGCPDDMDAYLPCFPPRQDQQKDGAEEQDRQEANPNPAPGEPQSGRRRTQTTGPTTGSTTGLLSEDKSSSSQAYKSANSADWYDQPKTPPTTSPETEQAAPKTPGEEKSGARERPELEGVPPANSRQGDPFQHRDPEWAGGQTDAYREEFAEAMEDRVVA